MAYNVITFAGYEDTKQYAVARKVGANIVCVVQDSATLEKGLLCNMGLSFFVVLQSGNVVSLTLAATVPILQAYAATL